MTASINRTGTHDPWPIGIGAVATGLVVLLLFVVVRPGGILSLTLRLPQQARENQAANARFQQARAMAQAADAAKTEKAVGEIISDIHNKDIIKRIRAWQTLRDAALNKNARARGALLVALGERNYEAVLAAYNFYISEGVPGSENTLISALGWRDPQEDEVFSHVTEERESNGITCPGCVAEACLNSGNAKLYDAAKDWAKRNHYEVKYGGRGTGSMLWRSH